MATAVFIDRDDTLIATTEATAGTDHVGDLLDPDAVRLLPGAGEACARLSALDVPLVVITNQGAIARGRATPAAIERVNDRVRELLGAFGVRLAGVYYAPHHPEAAVPRWQGDHPWRKPNPEMFYAAARELGINLASSWAVGDAARDGLSAITAGIASSRVIIVGRGAGIWYPDLSAAVAVIIPQLQTHPDSDARGHGGPR
ncbi:MAG: D-glycero-alpha-D-manno-heptose-1,7-bisphosphate 7-phosphatase [Phycisphaerales bacterium]